MKREPDIYVERCSGCVAHRTSFLPEFFRCYINDPMVMRAVPTGRRFPRWCPLLKGPVTIAALRKVIR